MDSSCLPNRPRTGASLVPLKEGAAPAPQGASQKVTGGPGTEQTQGTQGKGPRAPQGDLQRGPTVCLGLCNFSLPHGSIGPGGNGATSKLPDTPGGQKASERKQPKLMRRTPPFTAGRNQVTVHRTGSEPAHMPQSQPKRAPRSRRHENPGGFRDSPPVPTGPAPKWGKGKRSAAVPLPRQGPRLPLKSW